MRGIARVNKEPEVRRAELLDAAQQLFSSVGYEKTMIVDITKKAGVAKGTFYYYFSTKEAVLEAIMIEYAIGFVGEFKSISSNFTAPQKLQLFIERLFFPNHIENIFDKLWEERQFKLFYIICKNSDVVFNSVLSDIIKQGNQDGTLQVLLIDETISFLWNTLNCLWESLCNKEPSEMFIGKVKIAEMIIERIFGIAEGTLTLPITQR
ncbi:MAG: TetR/AcrR family transcriptional regulator [Negativicutes bacterium]